jgi:diguanylate cyclase (GGDEF)-like protein
MMAIPAHKGGQGVTIEAVQAELARAPSLRLTFAPALETRFQHDKTAERCANIYITVPIGLVCYAGFASVDHLQVSDLGPWVIWPPVVLVVLGGLGVVFIAGRVSAGLREALLSLSMIFSSLDPFVNMRLSHAAMAPYTVINILLLSVFGNVTLRLRFGWACLFSAIQLVAVLWTAEQESYYPLGARVSLDLGIVIIVAYGLIANYQLERSERYSFLLKLLHSLRADELYLDREKFSVLSLVDALTGLANRRAFDLRIEQLLRAHGGAGAPFALLLTDIDHFKPYNDFYGHPAGDACLTQIGQLLRQHINRSQDLVARYGGEEFAILLPFCSIADAMAVAEGLCAAIAAACIAHAARADGETVVTMSIGVAALRSADTGVTKRELIERADENLYKAKNTGRNRAVGPL